MKIKEGALYRLKHTTILRQFGHPCGTYNQMDNRIWPGDVGEVRINQMNGWQSMELVFSRERTVQIGTLYSDSIDWEVRQDVMENFLKQKAPLSEPIEKG